MLSQARHLLGRRGPTLLFAIVLSLPLAVGAYASSGHHSGGKKANASVKASDTQNENEASDESSDGTARFHGDGDTPCDWPDGVTEAPGNWSHGDYVSAWAKWAGQHQDGATIGQTVSTAAHSDCGKPIAAVSATHGQSGQSHGNSADAKASHKR